MSIQLTQLNSWSSQPRRERGRIGLWFHTQTLSESVFDGVITPSSPGRERERERERRTDGFQGGGWRGKGSGEAIFAPRRLVFQAIQLVTLCSGHSWMPHLSHCISSHCGLGSYSVRLYRKILYLFPLLKWFGFLK